MMLMLVATMPRDDAPPDGMVDPELAPAQPVEVEPTKVLAIRFFDSSEGCARVQRLAWSTIRRRYPSLVPVLGRGGRNVIYDVYEPTTEHGGWPKWLGPSEYYS